MKATVTWVRAEVPELGRQFSSRITQTNILSFAKFLIINFLRTYDFSKS